MRRTVLILCLALAGCHDEHAAAEKRQKNSDYAESLVPKMKDAREEVARIQERLKTIPDGPERQAESGRLRDTTKRLEELQASFYAAQKKGRAPKAD
jgi:hypothetical protein